MEEFARKNYTSLVTEQNGLAKSYVASFKITLEANNPLFTDDTSVLSNGEYLTASKTDGYTYFYDGKYVDRDVYKTQPEKIVEIGDIKYGTGTPLIKIQVNEKPLTTKPEQIKTCLLYTSRCV